MTRFLGFHNDTGLAITIPIVRCTDTRPKEIFVYSTHINTNVDLRGDDHDRGR